jgi:hypothetical protein
MIAGRAICIKVSKRNITKNKKRKASQDLEDEIPHAKKQSPDPTTSNEKGLSNKDFRKFLK